MKKPTPVTAPQYTNLLMNWIQLQFDDELIFPSKPGNPPFNAQALFFQRISLQFAKIYFEDYSEFTLIFTCLIFKRL